MQALEPLCPWISQARILQWGAVSSSRSRGEIGHRVALTLHEERFSLGHFKSVCQRNSLVRTDGIALGSVPKQTTLLIQKFTSRDVIVVRAHAVTFFTCTCSPDDVLSLQLDG